MKKRIYLKENVKSEKMPKRFVLDASLFEKYSTNRLTSSEDPISIDEVYLQLVKEGKNGNIFKELKSLMDLLEGVTEGKAVICLTEELKGIYEGYLDKIPYEIEEFVWAIVSNRECSTSIESDKLIGEDFKEIKNTTLKEKEIYLDVAKALTKKIIVSTEEDKNNIYIKKVNKEILFRHGIYCRCTWEYWAKIK
jgi:hypothetical protein